MDPILPTLLFQARCMILTYTLLNDTIYLIYVLSITEIATKDTNLEKKAEISIVPGEREGGSLAGWLVSEGHAAAFFHVVRLGTSRFYQLLTEARAERVERKEGCFGQAFSTSLLFSCAC